MLKIIIFVAILIFSLVYLINKPMPVIHLSLTSPDFTHQGYIPVKYSCRGENINPELHFANIPQKTRSMVLTVDDPDAPVSDFTHWLLWNIDPKTTVIKENSVPPEAVLGFNSTGSPGFIGPCPPSGTHHYIFRLYALDTTLNLNTNISKQSLDSTIKDHILDRAELTGLYQKQ